MYKSTIILIILIFFFAQLFSQGFTGSSIVALNGSQVDGDEQAGYKKPGLTLGVLIETKSQSKFNLETGMFYTIKGAKKIINDQLVFKTHFDYIEVPFLLKYNIIPKVSIEAGLSGAYLFRSVLKDGYGVIPESEYKLNPFDMNSLWGVSYKVTEKSKIRIQFAYSVISISDHKNMRPWYNNLLRLGLIRKFN